MKKKIWKIAYSILLVSSMVAVYFLHHYLNGQPNKVTEIQIGNQVQVTGICQYFSRAENDGGFDAEKYYASKNIVMLLKKAKVERRKKTVDWLGEGCRILKESARARPRRLSFRRTAIAPRCRPIPRSRSPRGLLVSDKTSVIMTNRLPL